ncbi:hypothetical protein Tco_1352512 [Tanacetum coccineum]
MADHSWIESMQDELNQFKRLQVWELVPRPGGKNVIALRWLWKNKCNAENTGVRNKSSSCGKSTPMATERLDADLQGTPTDQTNYRRMIGGLMYLTASRPDIAFATFVCARYQARPTVKHLKEMRTMQVVKMIVKAIQGEKLNIFPLCLHVVSMIWMRTQLLDYGFKYNRIPMYCDSKSAIAISCNPVQHSKTKHIDIRYHFIKEHVERGTVEIYFVGTEYQLADLFTKALYKKTLMGENLSSTHRTTNKQLMLHKMKWCPTKQSDMTSMKSHKKVDLENVQCPSDRKILMNIFTNHPLRFSIAASASVPWIYMAQFWHTLREDGSKYRLKFMLDRKELTFTLDDFRTIFHLPQANDNNHASFVPPPSFSYMVPFYKQVLGFTMEPKTMSNFKIPVSTPWQTYARYL